MKLKLGFTAQLTLKQGPRELVYIYIWRKDYSTGKIHSESFHKNLVKL